MRFTPLTPQSALDAVTELYARDEPAFVAHANAHTVNLAVEDPSYRAVLARADLVLNDGKGVMVAARLQKRSLPADLNGNFFTPLLLRRAADERWPVFLFGARPGVAERAAAALEAQIPSLSIVGIRDGYFTPDEEPAVIGAIKDAAPGLLLVGLGNPAQERWIDRNLPLTGARLGVGVGAFFDFQAGEVPRAPAWLNAVGLEWAYRLAKEPKRMWRRYVLGNPKFLYRVMRSGSATASLAA